MPGGRKSSGRRPRKNNARRAKRPPLLPLFVRGEKIFMQPCCWDVSFGEWVCGFLPLPLLWAYGWVFLQAFIVRLGCVTCGRVRAAMLHVVRRTCLLAKLPRNTAPWPLANASSTKKRPNPLQSAHAGCCCPLARQPLPKLARLICRSLSLSYNAAYTPRRA